MDTIVQGRHCQITDSFRELVDSRLNSLEKFTSRVIRAEVIASAYDSRREPDKAFRVEITLIGKGPVVRAEAAADDKNVAFDLAFDRLKAQILKAADRRRNRNLNLRVATQELAQEAEAADNDHESDVPVRTIAGLKVEGDGPLVVREKDFAAVPLSLAQALDEMELVGHDFFLYVDEVTGKPSVVYRRRAYDYGVIHLTLSQPATTVG
ncbi:MAG: ribosome-associated translation inhibitor RaiA [Propionibacteriaceae bacterium]|jgi:ribosomal subunit interface protein|nr:ribosome-associated translation inhibitor RaiA [Propionibacteriaceae bacterium]